MCVCVCAIKVAILDRFSTSQKNWIIFLTRFWGFSPKVWVFEVARINFEENSPLSLQCSRTNFYGNFKFICDFQACSAIILYMYSKLCFAWQQYVTLCRFHTCFVRYPIWIQFCSNSDICCIYNSMNIRFTHVSVFKYIRVIAISFEELRRNKVLNHKVSAVLLNIIDSLLLRFLILSKLYYQRS